ncbi:MSHA biogenesis protein MshP [Vibrio diazotrophicus]|uniref:MSHA biogenesis protein MshP n=1 Tax=Vibrio diazotrophicus TaxID=685 RepID=A0ABX4W8G6_VIBDI|nr:MSHA biogenesis protein MshP [Vibrio diazotrophicus]PNI00063.1 MSHA biogenesis protein MshP [Vibrio diazotrophicus]
MFPKIRKQTGNLYIVAVFVIVVMGFLATALSRMEWSNNDALAKELLGTRAWFATHSANELALTYLYPLNSDSSVVDAVCTASWGTVSRAVGQLQTQFPGCSIATSCNRIGTLKSESYYKVHSSAVCGSGQFQVARKQEVWVKE